MVLTPLSLRACMPRATADACTIWAPAFDAAAREFGIDTPHEMAGWLASMANESGQLHKFEEASWYGSTRDRMLMIFGNRAPSQAQLDAWRAQGRQAFDVAFFDHVYGDRMGNRGEGYKFRGLGPGQLTGRDNCRDIGPRIGVDLEADPEIMVRDPLTGARAFACYFDRHGIVDLCGLGTEAGFLRGMRRMNSGLADSEFQTHHLMRWRECRAGLGIAGAGLNVTAMQRALMAAGFPLPRYGADGDIGRETQGALSAFQAARGLAVTGKPDTGTLQALGMAA